MRQYRGELVMNGPVGTRSTMLRTRKQASVLRILKMAEEVEKQVLCSVYVKGKAGTLSLTPEPLSPHVVTAVLSLVPRFKHQCERAQVSVSNQTTRRFTVVYTGCAPVCGGWRPGGLKAP